MKMTKSLLFILLIAILSSTAFAQKITITGKVTAGTDREPLPGVSIFTNKKTAATTKPDGTYTISVDAKTTTLIFSYIGFTTQSVNVAGKTVIDVTLQAAAAATTDEVVVIGYGSQKKSSVTGAVSKFRNENLDQAPVPRLDQALQGKIAGVQIQNISSEAGSDPKIRVRGLSSVNAGASPLVVVDGVPVQDGLSFVNPADVESVEVLKDAASAAIYGSRGASGVIIITTKSGKSDRTRYNFKTSTGFKKAYETYPMMTITEYGNMLFYEASLRAKDPAAPAATINNVMAANERAAYVLENTLTGTTDWQSQALRNAVVRNLQLSVSGGNRAVKYFVSGAYQKDQGLMYHSEYERFNLRTKMDVELSKRVKLSFNINPSYIKRERPSTNFIDFVRFYSFLPVYLNETTAAFVRQNPQYASVKAGDFAQARYFNGRVYSGLMPDGSTWTNTAVADPFATANNTPKSILETRTITSNDYRVLSSADLTINIIKGLDFKTLASSYITYSRALDFAQRNSFKDGDLNRGQYNNRLFIDLLSENTLTYSKKIKDHEFTLLAGFTSQKTTIRDEQAIGMDYPSDNITTLNTALQIVAPSIDANGNPQGSYNLKNAIGLNSALSRITYAYKSKYLLSASFRADESSYFAPGHKWGYFPAASVGWIVSQEKFMDKINWINNLKLRGSYGVTGNNRITESGSGISYYPYIDLLYAGNYPLGGGTGTSSAGQAPSSIILSNPDLTWESTFQYNAGIDISLFKNILTLSVDAYQSKTDKLLLRQSTQLFTGVSQFWNNIGSLQNRGIEVELTGNVLRKKNVKWSVSGNISHNKNKILELGAESRILNLGERTEVYQNKIGAPLIEYFSYKTDGVWLSQAQIDDAKAKGLTSALSNVFVPGGLKLVDVNGDNKIDADDRVITGSPYPDFIWGLTNNVTYKNFDLSFTLQGSQGGQLINGDPNYNETKRINRNYNQNRWLSPMFPGDGKTPYSTVGFNWLLTDYVVEDASYYALREIIVGYTLPKKLTNAVKLAGARFYASAQNTFFHSANGYRGINTEARFTTGPYATPLADGYQRGSFPMPKTFLFGLDVNF